MAAVVGWAVGVCIDVDHLVYPSDMGAEVVSTPGTVVTVRTQVRLMTSVHPAVLDQLQNKVVVLLKD